MIFIEFARKLLQPLKYGNFSEQALFDVVIDEAAQLGFQTLDTNYSLSNKASFIFYIYYAEQWASFGLLL